MLREIKVMQEEWDVVAKAAAGTKDAQAMSGAYADPNVLIPFLPVVSKTVEHFDIPLP